MLVALICALQVTPPETLLIRAIERPPPPGIAPDSARYGPPQVHIPTRQGAALIWLLRASDTVFVTASLPDSTPYWGDDFVLSLDTRGDGAPSPQQDDFQMDFRRVPDSSVVYRGRNGRWHPPGDDPDWRLGSNRAGGGWEVSIRESARGWCILARLDPAWFAGEGSRRPRIAFRIYDDSPSGWYAWPLPQGSVPPTTVEHTPALWSMAK